MRKLTLLLLPFLFLACNSPRDNDREEQDEIGTTADNSSAANVEVLFRCDTITNSNKDKLSLLLSTYNEAIPVDTVTNCDSIPKSRHSIYQVPENIKGVAVSDKDVYYSAIKNDQVIIMKSVREDTMNYEVHLSIPLEPVVKEEDQQ